MSDNIESKIDTIVLKQEIMWDRLNEHLDSDEKTLSRINSELDKMNEHMTEYNSELRIHIAGVIQNREAVQELRKANEIFREELKELKEFVIQVKASWKTITIVAVASSTITGLIIAAVRIF